MNGKNDLSISRMAAVLIPVAVGSLLGLFGSIATSYYTSRFEQAETLRKERAAHLERAMTLTLKFSQDVAKAVSVGIVTKGDIGKPDEVAPLLAPAVTLTELTVVISLYFPELKRDVDQLNLASLAMMQRFDAIIDARDEHRSENAAAFVQRLQKETADVMGHVRSLRDKLGKLVPRNGAAS